MTRIEFREWLITRILKLTMQASTILGEIQGEAQQFGLIEQSSEADDCR
jgi:hypothetical protein